MKYIIELTHCSPLKKSNKTILNFPSAPIISRYFITDIVPVFVGKITPLITLSENVEEAKRFDRLAEAQKYLSRCGDVGHDYGVDMGLAIREIDELEGLEESYIMNEREELLEDEKFSN